MTIKDLKPAVVWNNFYGLTRCPRPSKHEEIVRKHLLDWAKEHKVEAFADETGNVFTVEEHSVNGGLGGAVAEYLLERGFQGKFKRIGLPDEFAVLGDPDEVYKYYGMDPEGIARTIAACWRSRRRLTERSPTCRIVLR